MTAGRVSVLGEPRPTIPQFLVLVATVLAVPLAAAARMHVNSGDLLGGLCAPTAAVTAIVALACRRGPRAIATLAILAALLAVLDNFIALVLDNPFSG